MDEGQKLTLLKQDLQMITNSNDDYLIMLLKMAEELIKREGIIPENTTEYAGIQIQYAAYLFRKRAGTETSMPRFLRWEMNNLLFNQKAKAGEST
jgi:hypothetical protein|uniref:Head Tail Connector Protein n=1 Tax=Phage sp. ctez94 TaxID=2826750 RepID=A0A8S5QTN0_9VIRU|nr:MAG TPA: Head Tail Connector Protein [Phage sp. ctez94]